MMDKPKDQEQTKSTITFIQVLSLVTVPLLAMPVNMVLGWSTVLPKIEDDPSFTITKDDVSWLVSIMSIAGLLTAPFTSSLMELLGPKRLVLLGTLPMVGFWMMITFASNIAYLYVARVGLGVIVCFLCTCTQPLVAELCPPERRGLIASSVEVISSSSVLIAYILAHFLSWRLATAVAAIPGVPLSLLLYFVPESPYWLLRKNKRDEAERSLRSLRGPGEHIAHQLDAMSEAAEESSQSTSLLHQVSHLRRRENGYPVFLLWLIFFLREFGGKNAIFSFTVYVFREAELDLDPFLGTVILGAVRVFGHIIPFITSDRVGRRPLLMVSTLGCTLSVVVAGLFLMLDLPGKSWTCFAMVLLYVLCYGLGYGPITWVYVGELIPTPVRSLGASLMVLTNNFGRFIMDFLFFRCIEQLGLGMTLLCFGGPNFVVFLITLLWLPETRCRSLEELQKAFSKAK